MITSLRAFLRFLYLCGETKTNLAAALLAVAQWPMATLPKSLEPERKSSQSWRIVNGIRPEDSEIMPFCCC